MMQKRIALTDTYRTSITIEVLVRRLNLAIQSETRGDNVAGLLVIKGDRGATGFEGVPACLNKQAGFISEDDLCSKLRVKWFTGTNSRSPVIITDCVRDYTEARTDCVGRRSEVLSVEEIERLNANLNFDPFADAPRFENGEINIFKSRTKELISPGGACECSRRPIRECVWVDPRYLLVGECMTDPCIGIGQDLHGTLESLACS